MKRTSSTLRIVFATRFFLPLGAAMFFAPVAAIVVPGPYIDFDADHADLHGDWFIFSRSERLSTDLNGDGDRDDAVLELFHLTSFEERRTGLAAVSGPVHGDGLAFYVYESDQGEDLNGDGDRRDTVLHHLAIEAGEIRNTGVAVHRPGSDSPEARQLGRWVVLRVAEEHQSRDLNEDRDEDDEVLLVLDLDTGATRIVPFAGARSWLDGRWLVVRVAEASAERDLNGDGDRLDHVDHVFDLERGELENLGLAVYAGDGRPPLSQGFLVEEVSERDHGGIDLDGDGFADDHVLHLRDLEAGTTRRLGGKELFGFAGNHLLYFPPESTALHALHLETLESRSLEIAAVRVGDAPPCELHHAGGASVCGRDDVPRYTPIHVSESAQGADLNADRDRSDLVVHVFDADAGEVRNTGLPGGHAQIFGRWLRVEVSEEQHESDENGDGDQLDFVSVFLDLASGRQVRPGVAGSSRILSDHWASVVAREAHGGRDLNGDGDARDWVHFTLHLATGSLLPSGMLGPVDALGEGRWIVAEQNEQFRGQDLTGDGDLEDASLFIHDLSTDVTSDLGFPGDVVALDGDRMVVRSTRNVNHIPLGPERDSVLRVVKLDQVVRPFPFVVFARGDCNGDGSVNIADAIFTLGYAFLGGPAPECPAACDSNGSGELDAISDAIYLLNYAFGGGPPPPHPFGECAISGTTEDLKLGCATPVGCRTR